MKHTFTPQDIYNSKGCYSTSQVDKLSFISQSDITIQTIINSEISISDKFWFVFVNCDLTLKQKKILNLNCAKINLKKYKENCLKNNWTELKEVTELTQLCEDYVNDIITLEE